MSDASDDALFTQVARELATRNVVEGLWTKAFALENGDDSKAKAHYIRLRVAQLQQQQPASQPEPRVEPTPASAIDSQAVESQVPVSLWARFWARNIDYLLCMVVFLLLSTALANTGNVWVNLLIAFVVPGIVLVGYDAILLSVFGQTIGKAIFGLSVESQDGGNLLFGDALRRSFKVWLFGNGGYLFFPMATAFMWWGARKSLAATGGHALWDAACNSRVAQPPIGGARFAFGSALGAVALTVAIGASFMVKEHNKWVLRKSSSAPPATSQAPVVEHGPWEQYQKAEAPHDLASDHQQAAPAKASPNTDAEERAFLTAGQEIMAKYPQLDANSPFADQAAIDYVIRKRDAYISNGQARDIALRMATNDFIEQQNNQPQREAEQRYAKQISSYRFTTPAATGSQAPSNDYIRRKNESCQAKDVMTDEEIARCRSGAR